MMLRKLRSPLATCLILPRFTTTANTSNTGNANRRSLMRDLPVARTVVCAMSHLVRAAVIDVLSGNTTLSDGLSVP
jgi:hypothetical protein